MSAYATLPPLQAQIMHIVAGEESEDGIHVSAVSRQVNGSSAEQVMEAIEVLMSDGLIFSTIDDLVSCAALFTRVQADLAAYQGNMTRSNGAEIYVQHAMRCTCTTSCSYPLHLLQDPQLWLH